MRVGFVGLGKLGLPVALAVEVAGHDVAGVDPSPKVAEIIETKALPYMEAGADKLLAESKIRLVGYDGLVAWADLIFVAVQTPHHEGFEGVTRLPAERADFDYTALRGACESIAEACRRTAHRPLVVIVSTVLPGTCARVVAPVLGRRRVPWVYSPSFIAMGTTIADFSHPEMVLVGRPPGADYLVLRQVHQSIHDAPILPMRVESAELAKVTYNTFVTAKVVIANTIMELAEKTGADCDEVTDALARATTRVISPKYLRGGMGDGGGCHPRDNIALSWLARRLDLSYDLFDALMTARERQAEWLVDLVEEQHRLTGLPIVVAGRAYKAGTNLQTGSTARLVVAMLAERELSARVLVWDPVIHPDDAPPDYPAVVLVGCNHAEVIAHEWAAGSVVIDPWGEVPHRDGVTVLRLGRK